MGMDKGQWRFDREWSRLLYVETVGSQSHCVETSSETIQIRYHFKIVHFKPCANYRSKRLRWSGGCVLAPSTQVRGFKPGRSRRIFQGEKIPSTPSFGGEVKPAAPCGRFTARKRSLNVTWKSAFRQHSWLLFVAHWSSPSRCLDLSRRVGLGDIWRRQWELVENRMYNKPNGCSATGPWCNKQTNKTRLKIYECQNVFFAINFIFTSKWDM
jgi:hypothetical protein